MIYVAYAAIAVLFLVGVVVPCVVIGYLAVDFVRDEIGRRANASRRRNGR